MHFVALCTDKPGWVQTRLDVRPTHVEWLGANAASIKVAGPFLDEAGAMTGSMLILECPDRAAAQALLDSDPYAKAGLFSSVELKTWRWVVGEPKA
ncbi:MAG: hypothetical protein JWN93_288 [Hyphomicrobiales bacterium]|nr:hypothetical protein [Hyphomicrobiales bacterium]